MHADLIGVILAGGKSERMGGGDKSLMTIADKPIIAHIIDGLAESVGRIAINANGDPARYASFGPPVFPDAIEGQLGPLAGIHAAMECAYANSDIDYVLTVPGDTPFFPGALIDRMVNWRNDWPGRIILAANGDIVHPVFGLWPVALRHDLAEHLAAGGRKVVDWAAKHDYVTAPFPTRNFMGRTIEPFLNVNTPEDLKRAEMHYRKFLA